MTIEERMPEPTNPLGMDGIEFIEYATTQPQAFGDLLQRMGFAPLARHRSREVMLYRQGPMNLIVNAHAATSSTPTVSAVALRVRDAAFAHKHSLDLGAWDMPTRASAMELNIPGIHGVGDSLIFRSVGYRGVPLAGVPFHEQWGVILNEKGRVLDPASKEPVTGLYAAGWIKRGPTGVIGTNKPDAGETVQQMLADAAAGQTFTPKEPTAAGAEALVRERQPEMITYPDWKRLDELEVQRGRATSRPRVKFIRVEEMLAALSR